MFAVLALLKPVFDWLSRGDRTEPEPPKSRQVRRQEERLKKKGRL